tara:strand:+ start:4023 stop:5045 length:1023 start_codon:yes stop_codon:yes gene_type:complete
MPTIKSSGDLITSISTDMADNNAGLISAEDVRHNMEDIVASIKRIVASGHTDGTGEGGGYPFYNNVLATKAADSSQGVFIAESGIKFPNWGGTASALIDNVQIEPYPGSRGIDHGQLEASSLNDDDHPAYYALNGARALTANFKAGNNWINASGYDRKGFKFVPVGHDKGGGDIYSDQEIHVSGDMRWADNSTMPNAKGVAQAWVQFDGSGNSGPSYGGEPVIRGYHGISGIVRLAPGKYEIFFNSGVFKDNNYVCMGTANGTTASGSKEDMAVNTVGFVHRYEVDSNPDLRRTTCVVKTEAGGYADAQQIDCVFFGYGIGETSGVITPTTSGSPSYTDP